MFLWKKQARRRVYKVIEIKDSRRNVGVSITV